MKIKRFNESWVSDSTDKNISINYGDKKPEISDVAKYTEQYLLDNFDNISSIDIDKMLVEFSSYRKNRFSRIYLYISNRGKYETFSIEFHSSTERDRRLDITTNDYNYLCDAIFKLKKRFNKKKYKADTDDILSEIDPVRINSNKYNI